MNVSAVVWDEVCDLVGSDDLMDNIGSCISTG